MKYEKARKRAYERAWKSALTNRKGGLVYSYFVAGNMEDYWIEKRVGVDTIGYGFDFYRDFKFNPEQQIELMKLYLTEGQRKAVQYLIQLEMDHDSYANRDIYEGALDFIIREYYEEYLKFFNKVVEEMYKENEV